MCRWTKFSSNSKNLLDSANLYGTWAQCYTVRDEQSTTLSPSVRDLVAEADTDNSIFKSSRQWECTEYRKGMQEGLALNGSTWKISLKIQYLRLALQLSLRLAQEEIREVGSCSRSKGQFCQQKPRQTGLSLTFMEDYRADTKGSFSFQFPCYCSRLSNILPLIYLFYLLVPQLISFRRSLH